MKKVMIFFLLLTMTATSFSQQTISSPPLTELDFLQKSKNQKEGAWLLLGGGTLVLAITTISAASNLNLNSPSPEGANPITTLAISGAMILGSVPLFIASARNRTRANIASAYFKFENTKSLEYGGIVFRSFPALELRVSL